MMRRVLVAAVLCMSAHAVRAESAFSRADLEATGVKGGLVVHVGYGDAKVTAALRADESYLVHGLDASGGNVRQAREHIRAKGLYGPVSVDVFDGKHLPYVDNLVNLVVSEDIGDVAMSEVMRVLAPKGVACIKKNGTWTKTVKPRPANIDEWTHYLHDASNNAVAHDDVVAIPSHIQWVGAPKWARHHNYLSSTSAMVSTGGRIFAIMDGGPPASLAQPPKWSLVARDAFNGVVLWKKPIGKWEDTHRPFRSGPTELSRRLVAVGDRVYVTLAYGQGVTALDAVTGKVVRTYAGTAKAIEILHHDGALYVVTGPTSGTRGRASGRRSGGTPAPEPKRIAAFVADTGRRLWSKGDADTKEALPTTLCAAGERLFLQNPGAMVCLDAKSGKTVWRAPRPVRRNRVAWSTPTVVVSDDVVLSADCAAPKGESGALKWTVTAGPKRGDAGAGELVAFSTRDGKELWRCPAAQGYTSPADLFVVDGLVWVSAVPNPSEGNFGEGRDLHTGEVKRRIDTTAAYAAAHHHRCYRNKATDRFILLGRTGVEFIALAGDETPQRHCWIRGGCQYGVLPANGLLYLPPHSCGCYIQSKLSGFWALAAPRSSTPPTPENRLEKGPAYGAIDNRQSAFAKATADKSTIDNSPDWPTYRHDPGRTGRTDNVVPAKLRPAWSAAVGGKLSGLVVAGGTVLVSEIDAHTIHAIDAITGKPRWRYAVGGRVDSPPTIHNGRAIFGSADGYTYCLRLRDGELVWRYLTAPADQRTVSFGQIESVWPVTGSVLVREGVVYCTAGRSSYLDGGMVMVRLDAATGKELGRTRFANRDPKTGMQPEAIMEDVELPGALPDVLVDDGRYIYLRDKRMTPDGSEKSPTVAHLYSSVGLLDDYWWHRTYWTWGERNWGRASGWAIAAAYRPSGRILVEDERTVFGYGRKKVNGNSLAGYHLFRADKKVKTIDTKLKNNNAAVVAHMKPAKVTYPWSRAVPVVVRAMVLAGDTLFAAGTPMPGSDEPDLDSARGPGALVAVSAAGGRDLSTCKLDAPPVFDGMAAAGGRLYVALRNGKIICLQGTK
jgi:outer membrane protein assembly factor BamB